MDYSNFKNLLDLCKHNTYCIILLLPFWLFLLICRSILCSEKKKTKSNEVLFNLKQRFFKCSLRSKIKWPIQPFHICDSFPGLLSSFSDRPKPWLEHCILYFVGFRYQAVIVWSGFYLTAKIVIYKFEILCCYEVQ